jgi:DNA-binding transcriptional LysR family regulator
VNFSIRQLRAFVATARLRSFTRAAEQLHVTQPGLSGMLRELEAQLDCRLFERTTRSVTTTAQGEEFLPTALRVLKELDDAVLSLGQITSEEKRRLSVGATPVIASSILPEACAAFAQLHPRVRVEIQDLDRSAIFDRVRTGALDAGFGAFLETSSAVRRRRLMASSLVWISAGHGATRAASWVDLAGETMLGLPPDNPIQQVVEQHLRQAGVPVGPGLSFNHLHTLLGMVESGAGSAVLPDFVRGAAARYEVSVRPLRAPAIGVDFYEITKSGRQRNDLLVDFGSCLVQCLARGRNQR